MEALSDPVALGEAPHSDDRLNPRLESFSQGLELFPRALNAFMDVPEELRNELFGFLFPEVLFE